MSGLGAVFDWTTIAAELHSAAWEPDPENHENEVRSVWLGTWLGISPSGKIYQPFACSNVAGDCPVCGGEGTRREPRTGRRARKRAARRERDFVQCVVKRISALRDGHEMYLRRVRSFRKARRAFVRTTTISTTTEGTMTATEKTSPAEREPARLTGNLKTYAKWQEGNASFAQYVTPGDAVDEKTYWYFLEVVPPAAMTSDFLQVGEAYDHGGAGGRARYSTFQRVRGRWIYCGLRVLNERSAFALAEWALPRSSGSHCAPSAATRATCRCSSIRDVVTRWGAFCTFRAPRTAQPASAGKHNN